MDGADVKYDGLKEAAASPSAADLDEARFGFDRAHPHRSARRTFFFTQLLIFALLIGGTAFAAIRAPGLTFSTLYVVTFTLFASAIAVRLVAAASLTRVMWRLADQADLPTYTILCPLYREANVIPDLVAALERIDYPAHALDIKLLVEGDDVETIAAALAATGAAHIEVLIIPACAPRTKPKALNVGLARARGEYVVVYDAEDRPHPQQLRAALAAFEDGAERLACVQAPLSIDNASASWISRQFAAEYAIQFREVLPLLARAELPLPLGGTSNHFRVDVLRLAGGWDPYNVSEDRSNFASKLKRFRTSAFHIPFVSQSCASAA
jgi:cellulose synthase/poly-beta-1,6-N-acetylglucosamine synthase-like glycosyltransferase